jgi:hypothetical protein
LGKVKGHILRKEKKLKQEITGWMYSVKVTQRGRMTGRELCDQHSERAKL